MIDLRRLHVLRAVDQYGTVTAAAEALHVTPSAASQQIKQLARELDVVLLEPHGRRVQLTSAAHRLLGHADAITTRWEAAEIDLRAGRDVPSGVVRVCGFPVAISTLLAPMTVAVRARHPQLRVQIGEAAAEQSFDRLFIGDADLAIVEAMPSNPPLGDGRFDQQALLDDPFDLVVPATHPLAHHESVDLAEAANEEWIISDENSTCRVHTYSACGAAGFTPTVAHHAVEWNAIANVIGCGLGVALVPRLAHLPPHLPVVRVPLHGNPGPARKILTCTRAGGRAHPNVAAVLGELQRAAASREPRSSEPNIETTAGSG